MTIQRADFPNLMESGLRKIRKKKKQKNKQIKIKQEKDYTKLKNKWW